MLFLFNTLHLHASAVNYHVDIIAYTYLYCNGLSDAYEYSYDEVYLGCGSDGGGGGGGG